MLIMFFKDQSFKEFVLPNTDNSENSIVLNKQLFGLNADIELKFEKRAGKCYIFSGKEYSVSINGLVCDESELKNNMIIDILTIGGSIVTAVVVDAKTKFAVFEKFSIPEEIAITVGSDETNIIQYTMSNLVSAVHCKLILGSGSAIVNDLSKNGVFVNQRKINKSYNLRYGDTINIFGLNIVYLGKIICLGASSGNMRISDILQCYKITNEEKKKNRIVKTNETVYYNRPPRVLPVINKGVIKIEAPPPPQFSKKKPLFNVIGPSFTMAVPMMLGTGLSVFSSMYSGIGSRAFMFTGIITAVGSAILGSVWAVLNLRQTRREEMESEATRYDAYGKYLINISEKLKKQYSENEAAMHSMYPSAEECVKYDRNNSRLWNRNYFHNDFLYCRLGLGNMDFQVKITVPEERFSVVTDQLKNKPEFIYEQYKTLKNVPVGIDLMKDRLVGIVGKPADTYGIIDSIITQIAANNSYTDVKIAFCGMENYSEGYGRWNYIKFLPHTWITNNTVRLFSSDPAEKSDMLYELVDIIRHRAEESEKREIVKPHIILIVSDSSLLDNELIMKYILSPSEKTGFSTIIVSEIKEKLPNSCNLIIEKTSNYSGVYNTLSTDEDAQRITFDNVNRTELELMCKRLSNIRINEVESGSGIPGKLDFFEMYGIHSLSQLHIVENWYRNKTYDSMRAVIGKKAGGQDCYLDIYEKYHGPHGLVAGTTGSGKSEILQTYILSLAVNFSPEDIAFFLIDFKGGGMANLFSKLPHLIGSISNLAGNTIRRAMISIKSENNRRQMLFNEYGVNNIDAYTRLYKNGEAKIPMPHLIIIIDEFAEMKREGSEEYINELISVAQIGRSLGVHLILATQKPSGTVSDNIWSNSKFKLCLRVQDRKDSNEMLHKPDAAYITQAGRCYLQVGNDELYELFQSGWSGAVYDPESTEKSSVARLITSTGKTAVIGNYTKMKKLEANRIKWFMAILIAIGSSAKEYISAKNFSFAGNPKYYTGRTEHIISMAITKLRDQGYNFEGSQMDITCLNSFLSLIPRDCSVEPEDPVIVVEEIIRKARDNNIRMPETKEKTQLEAIVEYIAETAEKNGYKRQNSLWLPVLPQKILLEELIDKNYLFDGSGWKDDYDDFSLESVIGMYDDPENQAQRPVTADLAVSGHIALCGGVTSGKSTFLQTLSYCLMMRYDPSRINFYFLDYSSGMMNCFESYPHTGGVVTSNMPEKTEKFFNMINRIMEERKNTFGGGNYVQYIKSTSEKIPVIVIVIDNYANFRDKTGNKYEPDIMRISREGLSYGIYLITSSSGFGINEIPNRIGENMKTVFALDMGDKFKFAEVFRNVRPDVLPDNEKKGRGLVCVNGKLLEFQTAVAVDSEDDYQKNEIIKNTGIQMSKVWKLPDAEKIPFIPEAPKLSDIVAREDYKRAVNNVALLPFAYTVSDASIYNIDLSKNYCYTIIGKRQSGKTNVLKMLLYSAHLKSADLVIYEKSTNSLEEAAEKYSAKYISSDQQLFEYIKDDLIPEFIRRNKIKKKLISDGCVESEIYDVMSKERQIFIFIDNLTEFIKSSAKPEAGVGEMAGALGNLISKGSLHNIYFFACLNTEDYGAVSVFPLYKAFVDYRKGILTGGNINSQRVFNFQNISFSELSKPLKKGTGLVTFDDDETIGVKVAIPLVRRDEL